jgi:pyruvate/2-oxoacid:ferredoxin oxidoreductase beta subunit
MVDSEGEILDRLSELMSCPPEAKKSTVLKADIMRLGFDEGFDPEEELKKFLKKDEEKIERVKKEIDLKWQEIEEMDLKRQEIMDSLFRHNFIEPQEFGRGIVELRKIKEEIDLKWQETMVSLSRLKPQEFDRGIVLAKMISQR